MPYGYASYADEIASMLEELVSPPMGDTRQYKIGLRSGTIYYVAAVRLLSIDDPNGRNHEVVAYVPDGRNSHTHSEIRFLASEVEHVVKTGLDGVSPVQAGAIHGRMTSRLVDEVISPRHEELMCGFQDLAAKCLRDRPQWFVEVVERQIGIFEDSADKPDEFDAATMRALLSDDEDDQDITSAVLLLVVDRCYDALESTYDPFITEDQWAEKAIAALPGMMDTAV